MTSSNPNRDPIPRSNVATFEQMREFTEAYDDGALARQESQLRAALKKILLLRRQRDQATQGPGMIVRALFAARESAAGRVAQLSPREQEVLQLVLAGKPSKMIAWQCGISQRTVENHRAAIMKKTGAKSIPALARLAVAAAFNEVDGPVAGRVARDANDAGRYVANDTRMASAAAG
jgi:DNA-binding CsgD family transcriptional regulator